MNNTDKFNYYKKGFGDRTDGWRIRKVDPLFSVAPFILTRRTDSEVFFEIKIPIDEIEVFIRDHRDNIKGLSIMHIVIASLVRIISLRPYINRFVVWNKIFARDHISFSLAIKRSLSDNGEETTIKIYFLPTDTLEDVVRKINLEIERNQPMGQENSTDFLSKIFGVLPDSLLRLVVWIAKRLDNIGLLPAFIFDASPFHASMFMTNLGSIGIESIFHHLYEFGTCSMFGAMGRKSRTNTKGSDEITKNEKTMSLKFVLDERICDGFYYASSMRQLEKIMTNPACLLVPPEKVVVDDGVGKKRKDISPS